ncbi:MAG: ParB N-terminal domain-containing protein [Patescibacteria group bacterium]
MKLSQIKIGNRHRKDMGDIAALAESIKSVGLLHPIVLNGDDELIVGRRRFEAVKHLGWSDVSVSVAKTFDDVHIALLAERDENTCRKDFTPSEAVSMATALQPLEKKAAQQRQAKAGPSNGRGVKSTGVEKFSEAVAGRSADKIAESVGMSRPTLAKATAVVEAAEVDPEHYEDIAKDMDADGKVDAAHKKLLDRAAKFPIPVGPTPKQIAQNSPAVRGSVSR